MKALAALYGCSTRVVASRARTVGFVVVGVCGVLVAWRVGVSSPPSPIRAAARFGDTFGLTIMAPITALVFGTAVLGDPVDDGTLVYLWVRPQPRWKLAVGALGAALTWAVPLAVIPAVLGAALITADPGTVVAVGLATAIATATYTALAVLLGLVTNRALVWGITYVLIVEAFVARGGRALGSLAVHSHAVSIVDEIAGTRLRLGYFGLPTSVAWMVMVTTVAVGVTVWRLGAMEVA
ncbi:MAG TPA: hypothetical protein VJM33_09465 [Microthrixaceae bacterium]|nr:hypothetical protein [Microthrixaceae bacterium]